MVGGISATVELHCLLAGTESSLGNFYLPHFGIAYTVDSEADF